ncbi:MAG TPA: DUF1579 domain-containing protein [Burkholderiales bacterium]|nr:DUF1579 domain-containing protein [Burkholderiales bacterium]
MPPPPQPQEQHCWLQQLVGEWTYVVDAPTAPGAEPHKHEGVERVRAIGEIWIQGESTADIPGVGRATMQLTLGYDTQKKRFVGTWFGSMMNYLWIYDGELDSSGTVLTLNAEGPSMAGEGKMAKYQDIITIVSPNERILGSQQLQPDGTWKRFMTATYKRKT